MTNKILLFIIKKKVKKMCAKKLDIFRGKTIEKKCLTPPFNYGKLSEVQKAELSTLTLLYSIRYHTAMVLTFSDV